VATRRDLLLAGTSALCALATAGCQTTDAPSANSTASVLPKQRNDAAPDDEQHWRSIAAYYAVNPAFTNLENGNWGLMAQPVLDDYLEHTQRVNRDNSYYARRQFSQDYQRIRAQVAERLGVAEDEVALTRGATEALQNLIVGFQGLTAGDAVMYADLDYDSMQNCLDFVAKQQQCQVIKLAIPEPANYAGLVEFYRQAMDANPRTRLLLLTHISHRTGLVLPVKAIIEEAQARGIEVIVDAAHSWGQLDFKVDDLGAALAGFNLHKWIGAPLGVGAMVIRHSKLPLVQLNPASSLDEQARIEGRVHTGTSNFAAFLSVPAALRFHDFIGPLAKQERLRYLRNLWTQPFRDIAGIAILTPDDPRLHAGISAFRLHDKPSAAENIAIADKLLQQHQLFTVHRNGVARGSCVRITPHVYNTADDMQRLVKAIREVSAAST
jgi:isopenicillin-N epimerase